MREISAISLRSQQDGDRYWGRLPGTPYDTMTMDMVTAEFNRLGFETTRVPFVIPSDWTPTNWQASYSANGKKTAPSSAFPVGAPSADYGIPLITLNQDEGFRLRDSLGSGAKVEISLKLDIEIRKDVHTANVIARLPGASTEEIVIAAHTDGFFQGAMDNAAGLASGFEIARHYDARAPRADTTVLV